MCVDVCACVYMCVCACVCVCVCLCACACVWGATHQAPLGGSSLLLSPSADVRSSDDVIVFEGALGYRLPGQQIPLAQAVAAFNKPVVVIVLSGMAVGMDFIAEQKQWPVLIPGYGGR